MKYNESLEKIEAWLQETGIRQFCRTECRGVCCLNYCKSNRCQRPPLSCATFICSNLRKSLFGFHNGEKYDRNHLRIADLIISAGYEPSKPMPSDADFDIPDELINFILSIKYEEDIHW